MAKPANNSAKSKPVRSAKNSGQPKTAADRAAVPAAEPLDSAPDEALTNTFPKFMIAGVGASAGGLEACTQLLQNLPAGLGLAIIVVQHLAPKHDSFLPELLAAHSRIRVIQVTEGVTVEPNCVYVIPPNAHMHIGDGKLHLVARPGDRTQHMPVDSFFRSLAEYAQNRSIGIILSGTASDGAIGIREIKGAGGITIVQEPRTAKSDGMPRAAINTGSVDLVLAPADIAEELVRITAHPLVRAEVRKPDAAINGLDEQLPRIFNLLRTATGVDFQHYKLPTIRRRLQRRMVLHKLSTLEEYIRLLMANPAEVNALYQDILIHVTRFFRDPESFEVLARKAFGTITRERAPESPIRVWIPGCASGEEAYSIAIALQEYLGEQASPIPIQIFGTDVSDVAIEHARAGVYPESITADVSPARIRRFFARNDGGYRINKSIRDLCIFARQDITRDPPFSRLDLILCRNVLIYLGANLQRRLMGVFHYALKGTGFLMLGSAETVGSGNDFFAIADKRYKLYTKKIAGELTGMEFPVGRHTRAKPAAKSPLDSTESRPASLQSEANQIILARYSPAGVVVDDDLQIVQFRGQTGRFLEPSPGDPSLNLLKMVREGLLYGLRTSIHEARKLGESVRREGLRVRTNGGLSTVAIEVVPLRGVAGERHFLILFDENRAPGAAAAGGADGDAHPGMSATAPSRTGRAGKRKSAKQDTDLHRIRDMEKELAASREYLQAIIQDLEAANEELQSANEEILSANEELQSTNEELDTAKEELQSTNEELNTVNEELQSRNAELSLVNSDLINLLGSVQIAIVMVSRDLRIRRFTPMAERILNLIATDVGRSIGDIKPNIDVPELESLIHEAIDSVALKERECRDRNGKTYSLRVRPYQNLENRIDGAVIALFENPSQPASS